MDRIDREATTTEVPVIAASPDFAEWLPPVAASMISQYLNEAYFVGHPKPRAALIRLGTDPRMEAVWKELEERERLNYQPTDQPFYPMSVPKDWRKLAKNDPEALQREAPAALAGFLATLLVCNPTVPTRAEMQRNIARHRAAARASRDLSDLVGYSMFFALRAEAMEQLARKESRDLKWVLVMDRQRNPPHVYGILRGVYLTMMQLFGQPMYRTASTIASVLANYPVSANMYEKHARILKERGQSKKRRR